MNVKIRRNVNKRLLDLASFVPVLDSLISLPVINPWTDCRITDVILSIISIFIPLHKSMKSRISHGCLSLFPFTQIRLIKYCLEIYIWSCCDVAELSLLELCNIIFSMFLQKTLWSRTLKLYRSVTHDPKRHPIVFGPHWSTDKTVVEVI